MKTVNNDLKQILYKYLTEIILDDLQEVIAKRGVGHCIQVTDLPFSLLENTCQELRQKPIRCEAYVLNAKSEKPWQITATKLIERRNSPDSVLVLFIPPELRTTAEDSFGINTFAHFPINQLYKRLRIKLNNETLPAVQHIVEEIIRESKCKDEEAICLFLLAIKGQDYTKEGIESSLYHLGLVPDLTLLDDPAALRSNIDRNVKAVQLISSPDKSLPAKLQSLGIQDNKTIIRLFQFFSQLKSLAPSDWLPMIVDSTHNFELTFEKWGIQENEGAIDELLIRDFSGMPKNEDGYPLFDVQNDKHLKVFWETSPAPKQCQGLSHFTIELMKSGVAVSDARTVKVGTSPSKARSTTLKDLQRLELEEGLYYVRVTAWSSSDTLLQSNESETIFFKNGGDEDEDEDISRQDAKFKQVNSLYEAMLQTQTYLRKEDKTFFDRKAETSWLTSERRAGRRYSDQFNVRYSASNNYIITVNAILRHIEEETLFDADCLGRWKLDLSRPTVLETHPELESTEGIDYELLTEFLLRRKELFQLIINQPNINSDIQFLVETSDLITWKDQIIRYTDAYQKVLQYITREFQNAETFERRQQLIRTNYQILTIDTVRVHLPEKTEAYLMLPTHPLKVLWGLQFARSTHLWLKYLDDLPANQVSWSVFDDFVPRMSSLNLPNTVIDAHGNLLINIDSIGPFWSIFVPANTIDARALVSRIKVALGSPETDNRFTTINGLDLARKIRRYLLQHPYITTLRINAIQPGSGAILVEMLLELEHYRPDLRYQIHLFSNDLKREELGNVLDELMIPVEKRAREEFDAFLASDPNSLFPKLIFSKHSLNDLLSDATRFEAHVSLLFDVFQVHVEFNKPIENIRSNFLYGLQHEYKETFSTNAGNIAWQRQVYPSKGVDVDQEVQGHESIVNLYQEYSHLIATFSRDGVVGNYIPTIYLPLGANDKNLISEVHQVSDWVFIVDRNFGLEYMDSPHDEFCPVYLIDYQPENLSQTGHRLMISTQHVYEVERIMRPVLERLNLPHQPSEIHAIVNALRSVSGRLVLKLLSSPQMANGALGMALARAFLEQAQLLDDMILIPLDAHPNIFSSARQEAQRLGEELSLRRTDLLLVEADPNTSTLTFHLLEVKFRQSLGLSDWSPLKEDIADQLENSVQVLRRLYDPQISTTDRFDRLIRTRELVILLDFYLDRSVRHGLVDISQVSAIKKMLSCLEEGYTLRLTRGGIVFHLDKDGYENENDNEVTYHYLGLDRVKSLISVIHETEKTEKRAEPDPAYITTRGTFTHRSLKHGKEFTNPISIPIKEIPSEGLKKDNNSEEKHGILTAGGNKVEDQVPLDGGQITCDILLGSKHHSPQFGLLGRANGQNVGLDLNTTNAISLFGVQGSGKSYTLGTILEMAVMPIKGINKLPNPLGAVVFHYSKTDDYKPEFVSMGIANDGSEVEALSNLYNAKAQGLNDIIVLVPEGKLEQRRKEFSGLEVYPITFDTSELDIGDWKFLMGVVGSDAMYVKKMNQIFKRFRGNPTLNILYGSIASADLTASQRELAKARLKFAEEYIHDGDFLRDYIRPGRLIVVDLRDELIEKSEALGLFMVMLKLFSNARHEDNPFNKLIVFDEAHKYMESAFIDDVVGVVREMRHKGTSVLIASQDPKSVPLPLIELSSLVILHQFSSPEWLKYIQKGVIALQDLSAGQLNRLQKGQAYIWSREASHHEFETRTVKVDIRPRVTKHGGETVKAVK